MQCGTVDCNICSYSEPVHLFQHYITMVQAGRSAAQGTVNLKVVEDCWIDTCVQETEIQNDESYGMKH